MDEAALTLNLALGRSWPAYKAQKIHSGPGQMGILHSHWLLEWEAVTHERSGSWETSTLGYSSSPGGHWPLTWVGSLSGMLYFYWPSGRPGSLGRLSSALNFDWLTWKPSFSSFSGISSALAGSKELLGTPSQWRVQGYQQIPNWGGEMQAARGHGPNSCGFHTRVG